MANSHSADSADQSGITTCPECGEPMHADEEWRITDRSLIGAEIGDEGIDGNYAHARCVGTDTGHDGGGD